MILEWIFELLNKIKDEGCIIKDWFHIYCPGCGGTRAVEALLRLHPLQSLYCNPVVVLMIIAIFCIFVINIIEKLKKERRYYKVRITVSYVFLAIWFIFFFIRNYLLICKGIDMLGDFV